MKILNCAVQTLKLTFLAAGFTAQGGVMMRHLSIAIGLAAPLVLSSSSSFAAEEAKFGSEQEAKAIMETAAEGKIQSVTYWWPRPGSETPLEKHTFYTKVGDQICGVGYYKQ